MKTRYYLFCLLTTIMAFFSLQTASAQTAQDALYIFRNDGKFNAFFYGDIDHIAYIRFASVYLQFQDAREFVKGLDAVLKAE